ncbi:CCA tRNA nucleotidyltransferase [Neorickettsia sp. 179522]|uniref:CCA tRNA nucleotidyltransferase n=1 Tax=Neorickettsia sp. 179522 TaxID=1714371 RepID=UPI000609B962|nr:CCA tRNA nucleotidyltransferase [Neorickettsia sp. 179522]KYH12924.1 poly(A) polymerase [Neorickettsia sp. 179522]
MKVETSWTEDPKTLVQIIRNNGGEARFVGGCVRDQLLGRKISDIDLATTLKPEETIRALKTNGLVTIPTGLKHGTLTVLINSRPIEITTLRQDLHCDGRHATVSFTDNWKRDAQRRDFTFNAMYMDIEGNIHDYFSGLEDLRNRRLKFVGEPHQRIKEDYLRILRAFRFQASICETPLSEEILHACTKHRKNISSLSGERIQGEMFKLLSYTDFLSTVFIMQEAKIIDEVLSAKVSFSRLDYEKSRLIQDHIAALALLVRNTESRYDLQWLYSRWKISKKVYQAISILLEEKEMHCPKKTLAKLGNELTRKLIKILHTENKLTSTQHNDFMSVVNNSETPIFPIMGRDLIPLGYTGPEIGKKLKQLEYLWRESSCTLSKDELILMAIKEQAN